MIELKARTARSIADEEEMLELGADCPIEQTQVYLKSEDDKVIADLIKKNKRLAHKDLIMASETIKDIFKNLHHHQYHRCLDMAARCMSEEKRLDAVAPLFDNDKECWEYSSDYWDRWHKRWLKIAEKIKEGV